MHHGQVKLPLCAHLTNGEEIPAVLLRLTNITPFLCLGDAFSPVALTILQ